VEAEQSLLGALLLDNQAFDKVADLVTGEDFYRDDHRRIWKHIARLVEATRPADVVTVLESIEASEDKDKTGGAAYLAALAQNTPSALNIRRYAELVRERSVQRRLAQVATEIARTRSARPARRSASCWTRPSRRSSRSPSRARARTPACSPSARCWPRCSSASTTCTARTNPSDITGVPRASSTSTA
jgi:replicative DNA helicase